MKKLLFVFFLSISFLAYAGSDILTDFSEKESVQASSLSITVTLSGNKLIIENAGPNTRLEIFSLLGVRVAEKNNSRSKRRNSFKSFKRVLYY